MNTRRIPASVAYLTLLFFIFNNTYLNAKHSKHSSADTIGKVGLLAGVAGLATYGLVQLGNWLFQKSDSDTTELAQQTLRESVAQYTNIITILHKAYTGYSNTTYCINDISEPVLYEIAKEKYHDADIALYLSRLGKTLKKLESLSQDLKERVNNALKEPTPTYETIRLVTKMQETEAHIKATLPSLHFVHDYLTHHVSYFTLFETEDALLYRYERDLHAFDSYQNDLRYLQDMIHQSVMLYQRRHNDPYPYRWYLSRLEEDIYRLHTAINKLTYTYTSRYNVACSLCNKLEKVREALLCSSYYMDELHAYEYAKLAQAAIAAQQMQAQALQQQAWELQRQNNLKEQALQQRQETHIFVM